MDATQLGAIIIGLVSFIGSVGGIVGWILKLSNTITTANNKIENLEEKAATLTKDLKEHKAQIWIEVRQNETGISGITSAHGEVVKSVTQGFKDLKNALTALRDEFRTDMVDQRRQNKENLEDTKTVILDRMDLIVKYGGQND